MGGMTARDSWKVALQCPGCGTAGDAEVSDDDRPTVPLTGAFSVDLLPDGFRLRKLGGSMRTTQFECAGCGMQTQR
jgi:predicted RNA-binding Zn-ribbon protein involved in translation (DUF1610 family)